MNDTLNPVVYFITVNYYSSNLIQELLNSIAATQDPNYHILIVNNSPDDTAVQALARLERITLLNAAKNLGFGGGCNLGMQHAYSLDPHSIIWLINPDAQLEPSAVAYVRQCLIQDPKIAILGTRIRDLDGNLWFSVGTFNPWIGSLKHQNDQVNCSPNPVQTQPSRWLSGCSMIFNLAAFDHCPLFDTQYFLDYEDADICERYFKQGYVVRVTQAVLINHQVSAITHRNKQAKFQHATFSKLYFLHKHGTFLSLALNIGLALLKTVILLPLKPNIATGRWRGLLDFMRWKAQRWLRPQAQFQVETDFTRTPS
ncbi:MAG TPA: glycosyltransferase family 2 protein [Leptolyngbyaceae cyanobacterium]